MTASLTEQNAINELKKFFKISILLDRRTEMFSDYVDSIWHQLMENKEEYQKFCQDNFGVFISHIDSSMPGASGYGLIPWISEYEKLYGKLSQEWFMDSKGNLDAEMYNKYLDSGEVIAAWKCNPAAA